MDNDETIIPGDGPWEKHKAFWFALAGQVGATPQQAKFAFALSTGHSQTSAARFAGYAGEPRSQGYSSARTRRVKAMLVLAEADGWQSPSSTVSEEDKRKLLNSLIRSTDPSVRLRAIELADKREERRLAREREDDERNVLTDPLRTLDELSAHDLELATRLAWAYGINWQPPEKIREAARAIRQVAELAASNGKAPATN